MKVTKIETFYSAGSARFAEDLIIADYPHFIVADGTSDPYLPENGPKLRKGLSGGQIVCQAIKHGVQTVQDRDMCSFRSVIEHVNWKVSEQKGGIFPLSGACVAGAKINDNGSLELFQCGDCMIFWKTEDGTFCSTNNQVRELNKMASDRWTMLMNSFGNTDLAWEKFVPYITDLRKQHANMNFGFLNGYLNMDLCQHLLLCPWLSQAQEEGLPETVIICSDGFFRFKESNPSLAELVVGCYQINGLREMARLVEIEEERRKGTRHTDFAEKSAIALELEW